VPTYQYACTECGHAFEQVQSFSDDALTTCPECTGRLRKVFNAVGVVFKGSGFYRTDSRSNASATESSGSSGSSGSGSSDTKTKSDTKTETKSGSKSSDTAAKTPAAAAAGTAT
jgi:putative FmdB family regulatory protein